MGMFTRSLWVGLTFATCSATAFAAHEEVVKPLKTVVGSVRYGKDLAALKLFANEEQGQALLGDDWAKGTDAQRKEFIDLFHTLFAKKAFPKIRANFEHLETVLYEEPEVDGNKAHVASTIVILHPMKKQEIKVKYELVNHGGWHVVDVAVLGDSMLKGIREDQIIPLMKDGGWNNLLTEMRKATKELEGQALK
jgi:phospholipid transport system substrate-binding protein